MTAKELPSIVFAQGAVQPIEIYAPLHSALESLGYTVIHPVYPTLYEPNETSRTTKSLYDDAASLREVITSLVQGEGRSVFVVSHSYGGLVASEAILEDLTYAQRQKNGLGKGGVLHLLYMCAAVLPKGESIVSRMGAHQIAGFTTSPNQQLFTLKGSETSVYSDLPTSEATRWDSLHLWQSMKSRSMPATNEVYRYLDTTYLIAEDDAIASVDIQEMCAEMAGAHIERIRGGHCPWLAHTVGVANIIDSAARKAVEGRA